MNNLRVIVRDAATDFRCVFQYKFQTLLMRTICAPRKRVATRKPISNKYVNTEKFCDSSHIYECFVYVWMCFRFGDASKRGDRLGFEIILFSSWNAGGGRLLEAVCRHRQDHTDADKSQTPHPQQPARKQSQFRFRSNVLVQRMRRKTFNY